MDEVDPSPIGVAAAVIRQDGRLLVCQRPQHKRYGGLWEFPGGKLEFGETADVALRRELWEELLLTVTTVGEAEFKYVDTESGLVIGFLPVFTEAEPTCCEHAALSWGTLQEIVQLPLAPADRSYIESLLGCHWQSSK